MGDAAHPEIAHVGDDTEIALQATNPEESDPAKLFTALCTGYRVREQEFARGGG